MFFAKNVRYLRTKRRWSQEDLANRLGYKSFTTIAKWESGVSEPSIKKAQSVATVFGEDVRRLIDVDIEQEQDQQRTSDDGSMYYLDPEAAEMAKEMYERPELKALFDASRNVTREDIEAVSMLLARMNREESNGHDD